MEIDENTNNERLQRAIKCLQLIQRTNPQKSAIAKAAAKAIIPLLAEAENRPLPPTRSRKAKPPADRPGTLLTNIPKDAFKPADLPLTAGSPQVDPKTGNYADSTEGLKVGEQE
jgi:hypothetical protein